MIKRELDLNELDLNIDFEGNMHKNVSNVYLSDNQMAILDKYKIDYKSVRSVQELMYQIEFALNELDADEDLEKVSLEIAEFNYYHNTNK